MTFVNDDDDDVEYITVFLYMHCWIYHSNFSNSFFVRDVHGEFGLINAHLFDAREKSGFFLSGNLVINSTRELLLASFNSLTTLLSSYILCFMQPLWH